MQGRLFSKLYGLFSTQFLNILAMLLLWFRELVNGIKDQVDKLANLDILVASLNDISEENALGCKKQGTV